MQSSAYQYVRMSQLCLRHIFTFALCLQNCVYFTTSCWSPSLGLCYVFAQDNERFSRYTMTKVTEIRLQVTTRNSNQASSSLGTYMNVPSANSILFATGPLSIVSLQRYARLIANSKHLSYQSCDVSLLFSSRHWRNSHYITTQTAPLFRNEPR